MMGGSDWFLVVKKIEVKVIAFFFRTIELEIIFLLQTKSLSENIPQSPRRFCALCWI
jgi:hypothetical protein